MKKIEIDEKLMIKIAGLHYIDDISQKVIAEKLNISKTKINRIIKEAKTRGLVKISIKEVERRAIEIEKIIETKFGLKEALIYLNSDKTDIEDEITFKQVGNLGAKYIERVLKDDLNISLSWGKTLYYVLINFSSNHKYNINIFATLGGLSITQAEYQNNNLVRILGEKIQGSKYYQKYLPLIIDSLEYEKLLKKEDYIYRILKDTTEMDYYFTGIGTISTESRMFKLKAFTSDNIDVLKKSGIIGEIGLNFFDINGNFINSHLDKKISKLGIEDIKKIKNRVIIAFGKEKIDALKAILKTKIPNVLITDSVTAESVLE